MYVDNIRQSSERMREMLNTLLDFFRLDNGKEQPNLSPCRISAITHILETEFMPIAMNKGLTLIVESHTDAVVLTDKERILQIGNSIIEKQIEQLLQSLPEVSREVFQLKRAGKLSNKEIASQLDLTERAVEAHFYRTMKLLKEELRKFIMLFLSFYFLNNC